MVSCKIHEGSKTNTNIYSKERRRKYNLATPKMSPDRKWREQKQFMGGEITAKPV